MKTPSPFLCAALALACALLAGTAGAATTSTLYVACNGSDNIQVLSTTGAFAAAIPVSSPATPIAVAFDRAGNLYVASNHSPYVIEKFAPNGTDLGAFTSSGLNQPEGLAFDGAGNLYVSNYNANSIEKFSSTGADLGVFVSGLSGPVGLTFDQGNLYVVNSGNKIIGKYSSTGGSLANYTSSNLNFPFRIAFDGAHNFYVASLLGNTIEKFSSTGVDQGVFANTGINSPSGLAFDADGTLYVCNAGSVNIEKFSAAGADLGSIASLPANSNAGDIALLAPGGQIQFSSATYQTFEDAGMVTITANRTGGSRGATSVAYTTTNSSAQAGTDYTQSSGSLSWTDGDTAAKTFTVPIIDRGITTGSVNFTVAFLGVTGTGTFGMPAASTVTITDNDVAPAGQLQFSAATYQTFEDAGSFPVTVSRVGGSNGAVSVAYSTVNGTASAGVDYTAASGTLSWASGDMTDKTFMVPLTDRKLTSGSVNFGVNLSQATGTTLGTPTAATVTIIDNDTPPGGQVQFSAATYQTFEDAGTVTITLTRVGGTGGATSVTYTTTDGTAKAGTDYGQSGGTLSWADGDGAAKTFTVPIIDRGITTGSVNFTVAFLGVRGTATLGMPSVSTVTITDNDVAPAGHLQFSAATYQTFEDAGNVVVTVSRVGGTGGAASVAYSTVNGTASAGVDYTAASGTLSWASGDAADKTFTVPILDRHITGGNMVGFTVNLGVPTGATLGSPALATVSITDNDAGVAGLLQFSAATYQTSENAGNVTITVSRVGGTGGAASVAYSTVNGTASAGVDYTAASGTLSWASGDAADKTFTVPILDRHITSGNMVGFSVNLGVPSGATLGSPSFASVSIADNDFALPTPGQLQFSAATYQTSEAAGNVTITVRRVGGAGGAASVAYSTVNGTALATQDYTVTGGTLSWASGDGADKTFTVPLIDRGITDGRTVNFSVNLSSPTGAALGSVAGATVAISDNDQSLRQPTITLTSPANNTHFRPGDFALGLSLDCLATVTDPDNQLGTVEFRVNGLNRSFGPLSHTGAQYGETEDASDLRGKVQVDAVATSKSGVTSISTVFVYIYTEPTVTLTSPPKDLTVLQGNRLPLEAEVTDPDAQVSSVHFLVSGTDTGDVGKVAPFTSSFIPQDQDTVVAEITLLDGTVLESVGRKIAVQADTAAVSANAATVLALLNGVRVAEGSTLIVTVFTQGGFSEVDFYADGILIAIAGGDGHVIPAAHTPGRGPITHDASAASGSGQVQFTYQVPADSKTVSLTAVTTLASGVSRVSAAVHVNPVAETGAQPVVTVGPIDGGEIVKAGATFAVPVSVSAGSTPIAMVQYFLNGALVSASTAPPYSVTVTPPVAGAYALTAIATDTNGVATVSAPLVFQAVPTVSVAVKGSGMVVVGGTKGKVVFTRTGDDLSAPLTVYFKFNGAANVGVNFRDVGRQLVIPAGASSAILKIKALDTGTGPLALSLNVKLKPAPDASYVTAGRVKARLTIEQTQ